MIPAAGIFRVGRKVGRTVYTVLPNTRPNDDGVLVGMLDTRQLAAFFVEAANDHTLLRGLELLARESHMVDRLGGRREYLHNDLCRWCVVLRQLDELRTAT